MNPPEALPSQSLLKYCASAWGLKNLAFIRKMENIVYSADSKEGKVYLRLTSPLRRGKPEIEAEIHWIEHLASSGIAVPKLIPGRKGNKIVSLHENNQQFEAVVFKEVRGGHPSIEVATSPAFLRKLGALIAKMHLASERYEKLHHKREEWFEERGLRHALTGAANSAQIALRSQLKSMVAQLHQLPRTPSTYGLIHADLGALNLFVSDDNSIVIIDFDDSCYHWFVFDLAIVLFSIEGRFREDALLPDLAKWLKDLLEGYQSVRLLSQDEIDRIPFLIRYAQLRLYFWIEYHESLNTFHKDAIEKVRGIKEWLYQQLTKH